LLPQIKKDLQEENELAKKDSVENIKQEIELEKFLIADMNKEMESLEQKIKKQGPDSLHLNELVEAFKPEEEVLESLRKTRALLGADLLESTKSSVEEQDEATVYPVQNIKKLIMMAGGAGGAAMGLVLLVSAYGEFRARRITAVEDVCH